MSVEKTKKQYELKYDKTKSNLEGFVFHFYIHSTFI